MGKENKRRFFLKQLFSLMAFSAGSVLSYKGHGGLKIGKSGRVQMGLSEACAKDRVKKIACEEHGGVRGKILKKGFVTWTRAVSKCR